MERGPRPMMHRMMEELDLSDEQRSKLEALRESGMREGIRIRADLEIARLDLRQAMRQADPSAPDVKAKVAKVNGVRAKMLEHRVDGQLKRQAVLTPEQRTKLEELRRRPMDGTRRGGWGRGMRTPDRN